MGYLSYIIGSKQLAVNSSPAGFIFKKIEIKFLRRSYQVCWGSEEYKIMKRGRKNHGCVVECNVEKGESNINFPSILRLLGRMSRGEEDGNFGDENPRFQKMRVGKNMYGTLYNPVLR